MNSKRAWKLLFLANGARRLSSKSVSLPMKKLFTPGPLLISKSTKEAMLRDIGSRDSEFVGIVENIKKSILNVAKVTQDEYTTVILQGSGTYAVEAALRTATPHNKEVLIVSNGAYGRRMAELCERARLKHTTINFPETERLDLNIIENHLKSGRSYSTVGVVHCETSTGLVNDVTSVGTLVKGYFPDCAYVVDAMSSFGAIPLPFQQSGIDYLVTSANKCLEGVPGFALVIARLKHLNECKGNCMSMCLDLEDQHRYMRETSQFRFTPPTHALLAMNQALKELEEAGGVSARGERYKLNCQIIRSGMRKLGFQEFVPNNDDGFIITSFNYPKNFSFPKFYDTLSSMGQVIYAGKVTHANTFRIGHIGLLNADDSKELLKCIEKTCIELGMSLPVQY